MMRRARIKVTANLSASRRSTNKTSSDTQSSSKEVEKNEEKCDLLENVTETPATSKESRENDCNQLTDLTQKDSELDGNKSDENFAQPEQLVASEDLAEAKFTIKPEKPDESTTFKTPMQLPRAETDSSTSCNSSQPSSSNKFKRFKAAPRLTMSRNVPKAQNADDVTQVDPVEPTVADEPEPFSPPTPTRTRPETPREVAEVPSFITNHNLQHPTAPPSPFPYLSHGHGRIRTESLCSMKSNRDYTVANLQPRKNIRTEDQKIIDIKRESRERLSNKDMDKSKLRMFDMIYFNPANNPMKPRSPQKMEKVKKVELIPETPPPSPKIEAGAIPVPQLRLNANGEMVLDETSLVVENEQQKQNRILLASNTVVYDDDLSGNGYYKRQQRTKEWSHEETVKFYRCLNTVGTDFSLMLNLFPNRSRRDLKLKFKKEERSNPSLIDKALLKHNTFDLDELKRELDEEEEERRKEAEAKSNSEVKEHLKRKILKKQEAKLKAQQSKSKIEQILSEGDLVMNAVDNILPMDVKENLELSGTIKKRQYKKRVKVEEDGEGSTPAKKMRNKKEVENDDSPATKKPRKSRKNEAAVTEGGQEQSPMPSGFLKVVHRSKPTLKKEELTEPRQVISSYQLDNLPIAFSCENENSNTPSLQESTTVTTAYFFDESGTRIECQVTEDVNEPVVQELVEISQPPQEATPTVSKTEKLEVPEIISVIHLTNQVPEAQPQPDLITVPEALVEKKQKTKSRKKKFKPTLVTRMKLDANGEMVPDDTPEEETKLPVPEQVFDEVTVKEDESVEEIIPETSKAEAFDEEAFLDSLDMEKLFIVEAQRDGKDVFEIHGTDPVTQEMCDKPMDLPSRISDLIIKIMTQSEDDE